MVLLVEFLNRISFFSILSWSFFLISVSSALVLTSWRTPRIRRYRRILIGMTGSALVLGIISWSVPFFAARLHPDQSRLTPMDSLTRTEWIEPLSNPESTITEDEIAWVRRLPYRFKYKLKLPFEFDRVLSSEGNDLVIRDRSGNIRGFNAYTGLNHWTIPLHTHRLMDVVQAQKRLTLLDRTSLDSFRISSLDLQNPSLLWQRNIPNCREGGMTFDSESQTLLVSTGGQGIWSLKARSGEVLWKRPEIYSRTRAVRTGDQLLVYEPKVGQKTGAWHLLDSHTGKSLRKVRHSHDESTEIFSEAQESLVLVKNGPRDLFALNPVSLERVWSFQTPEPLRRVLLRNPGQIFLQYASARVELRSLQDNSLRWQQVLSSWSEGTLKLSPNRNLLALPLKDPLELNGMAFHDLETGAYLYTARASEPLEDLWFWGDWLYLFSRNHAWSFRK
jgi:hypothetical protein